MADSLNYKEWYYKAKIDIKSAKILFDAEESEEQLDYSIVAFHCQQCIEKYLKGYYLKVTGKLLGKTHNLEFLCTQVAKADDSIKRFVDDCKYVNEFYIEPRYPADFAIVNSEEGRNCLNAANKIHNFILGLENMEVQTNND